MLFRKRNNSTLQKPLSIHVYVNFQEEKIQSDGLVVSQVQNFIQYTVILGQLLGYELLVQLLVQKWLFSSIISSYTSPWNQDLRALNLFWFMYKTNPTSLSIYEQFWRSWIQFMVCSIICIFVLDTNELLSPQFHL